jgi:hypothetical protein
VEGAPWKRALIGALRVELCDLPSLKRIVVAIDPNADTEEDSKECGIVYVGLSIGLGFARQGHARRAGECVQYRPIVSVAAMVDLRAGWRGPFLLEGLVLISKRRVVPLVVFLDGGVEAPSNAHAGAVSGTLEDGTINW